MSNKFSPDDKVILHSPHSGESLEVIYRGPFGFGEVVVYNPASGMQYLVPVEWIAPTLPDKSLIRLAAMLYEYKRWGSIAEINHRTDLPILWKWAQENGYVTWVRGNEDQPRMPGIDVVPSNWVVGQQGDQFIEKYYDHRYTF